MISRSLAPSSARGRTSRRVSRRTVNQSTKSIDGWYGMPAHGANPGFRAPQAGGGHGSAAAGGGTCHALGLLRARTTMAAITATGLFRLSEPVLECLHLGHAGYRHFALDA